MLLELDWLTRPPADFRVQLRNLRAAIADGAPEAATQLRALAAHSLDLNQLDQLGRTAATLPVAASGLRPLKLGILGDGTQDLIAPALAGSALRHGLALSITTGDYEEACVKRALSEASSRTVVLASPEKLHTASPFQIAPLSQVNDIVVHRDVEDALVAPYRDMGISVTLA